MKRNKNRELLINEIRQMIPDISKDTKKLNEVITHLKNYHITTGNVMGYINNAETMENANIEDLLLFAEQLHVKLNDDEGNWINEWLSNTEIKELRTYQKTHEEDEHLVFPLTFDNAIPLGNNSYAVNLSNQLIAQLYRSGLLRYNPRIQRESKRIKSGDEIFEVVKLNPKNVDAIKEQAVKGDLLLTTLYYNCRPTSADNGVELSYDGRSRKLTITEGTVVDILDGSHRTTGIYKAYMEKSDLQGSMLVVFSNFSEAQVKRFQVDRSKATPISKGRISELAELRQADTVVQELKASGDLKDRITSSETVKYSLGELVTYSTLSDAIDKHFKMKNKLEALETAKKINEYIMYLFGYYSEHINNDSLLFKNKMFYGHMYLTAKMLENNVSFTELRTYLDKVDFSREAEIWKEYKVLVNGAVSGKSERGILKIFKEIIWGGEVNGQTEGTSV